jgi:hypothetical protein
MQLTNLEVGVIQRFLKAKHFPCPITGENCRLTSRYYTEWSGGDFPHTIEQIPQPILQWWVSESGLDIPPYLEVTETDEPDEEKSAPDEELKSEPDEGSVVVASNVPEQEFKADSDMSVTVGGKSQKIGGVSKRKRRKQ